ncbi:hypothetical protein [uncultured Gilliamella sp.]|uniref:hypothetical protein n=1 Tax=uncultured Gilliamella sp. TaxID=1193505 RepID=UPI0025F4BFEF|nr:hypothetical protein [uncultured Gilliamella sp.]
MNISRSVKKWSLLFVVSTVLITACNSWLPNKGTIILDMRDKVQHHVTSQDLPKYYKLGDSEQELQKFETFCREEIRASQLDGSEEIVFENVRHGIHGQVEFKKCSDRINRIYQY